MVGSENQVTQDFRFIFGYSSQGREIKKLINRNWPIILGDPIIGHLLPKRPPITFSRAPSMRDQLVSNNLEQSPNQTWLSQRKGFFKCKTCKACQHGLNTTSYRTPFSSKEFSIDKALSCKTDYAIYVLECPCGLKYIGSTILQSHKRILQHIRAIKNKDPSYPVARHFEESHKSDPGVLKYYVVDHIPRRIRGGDRTKALRLLETKYILNFDSKHPGGLNQTEDLYTCL